MSSGPVSSISNAKQADTQKEETKQEDKQMTTDHAMQSAPSKQLQSNHKDQAVDRQDEQKQSAKQVPPPSTAAITATATAVATTASTMATDNDEVDTKYDKEKEAVSEQPPPDQETHGKQRRFVEQRSVTQRVYDPESDEAVLQRDIPNKIIVARGKKISFYYERARRILRLFDGMIVTGFGPTVCVACSLVEVLRRNEMAEITHIETKFDSPINYVSINEHFNNPQQQAYYENAPPETAIEFHLAVGKYGKYLSGYHQRKMIEVFEKYDQLTGVVSVEDVRSMHLYEIFHCNAQQIASAEKFIADSNNLHGDNDSFILPDFIRYCSLIVHPLIKDNVFKRILAVKFGIGSSDKRGMDENDVGGDGGHADHDDHDDHDNADGNGVGVGVGDQHGNENHVVADTGNQPDDNNQGNVEPNILQK